MNIYKKLQDARIQLQNTKLKKSGHNKFAGYNYFELGDFLPEIQNICNKVGLCGMVSFTATDAYLTIHETDGDGFITFTSPMSSAALKGCHDVQNLGAVQTYLRRYLWVNAFEIVEHDALEPTVGSPEKPVAPIKTATGGKPHQVIPAPTTTAGKSGEWQLTVMETADTDAWMESLKAGVNVLLQLATTPDDVANIFKNNRVVFDKAKELDEKGYAQIMVSFSATKKSLTKE
jgi:hypothetical protein